MKRGIPLFIVDRNRRHKRGECDFIVCTDTNNGFIACVDYVDSEIEEVGKDYRIGEPNNGVSCRIKVMQYTGSNPTETDVRSLLKRAMTYYVDMAQSKMDVDKPSKEDCCTFLEKLILGNRHNLEDVSAKERKITAMSIRLLEACEEYLKE